MEHGGREEPRTAFVRRCEGGSGLGVDGGAPAR